MFRFNAGMRSAGPSRTRRFAVGMRPHGICETAAEALLEEKMVAQMVGKALLPEFE